MLITKRLVSKMDFKHPNAYELLLKYGFFGAHFASMVPPELNHLSLGNMKNLQDLSSSYLKSPPVLKN